MSVSYSSVYGLTRVLQRGFESLGAYRDHLARAKGFESRSEYEQELVRKRGFESYHEYKKQLAKERTKRGPNRTISQLMKSSLAELGESQSWLARELGVSRQAVSLYAQGKSIPTGETLTQLLDIICPRDPATRRGLDDLVE